MTTMMFAEKDVVFTRFVQLLQQAPIFEQLCQQGDTLHPQFTTVTAHLFCALYAADVEWLDMPLAPEQRIVKQVVTTIIESDCYKTRHPLTIGDDLLALICAMSFAEAMKDWLAQHHAGHQQAENKRDTDYAKQQLQQARTQMFDAQATDAEKERARTRKQFAEKRLEHLQRRVEQLRQMPTQSFEQMPTEVIVEALEQAYTKGTTTTAAVQRLIGDDGQRRLQHIPLRQQLALAEKVQFHPNLREIAELAGRFRRIAKKKQKQLHKKTMERKYIVQGQELARLLPVELANWAMPRAKQDFLRRFSEHQTLMFSEKGKSKRGRGPLIICMDESSSMSAMRAKSKAFCLALMMTAKKQRRDVAIIPFATTVGQTMYVKNGQYTSAECMSFCDQFLHGGTNYEQPLQQALHVLTQSRYNEADIIFVTDGASHVSDRFLLQFQDIKKRKQFQCLSVVLQTAYTTVDVAVVAQFSDVVYEVDDLEKAEDIFTVGMR